MSASTSTARRTARFAAVIGVVAAGLLGTIGTAAAAPAGPVAPAPVLKADLVVNGPLEKQILVEAGTYYITTTVANIGIAASQTTDASFTFQPVILGSIQGRPVFLDRGPATVAIGYTPGLSGSIVVQGSTGQTGKAALTAPNSVVGSGLTRVTVCLDAANRVSEFSETNNCRAEIVTL